MRMSWIEEKVALKTIMHPVRSLRAKLHYQQRKERLEYTDYAPTNTRTADLQRAVIAGICQVR
jgi:hypothetical protein